MLLHIADNTKYTWNNMQYIIIINQIIIKVKVQFMCSAQLT